MSTRSLIIVEDKKKYYAIYVHYDGYPEARIPILKTVLKKYGYAKVKNILMTYKDFSSIGTELEPVYSGVREQKDRNKWIYSRQSSTYYAEAYSLGTLFNKILEGGTDIQFIYVIQSNKKIDAYKVIHSNFNPTGYTLAPIDTDKFV